jgi:ribosome-associated translation inhibitor RaiA
MSSRDFDFEFYSEAPDPADKLKHEAERRLRQLAEGHTDMIGASVVLEPVARKQSETPLFYEARIVAYLRPSKLVTTEQAKTVAAALTGALEAMERQVRERRDKLYERWKQPAGAKSERRRGEKI